MQAFLQRTNRFYVESIGLAASVMLLAAAVLIAVTCFLLSFERAEAIARSAASIALPPLLVLLCSDLARFGSGREN
jgi:hypothetical protein